MTITDNPSTLKPGDTIVTAAGPSVVTGVEGHGEWVRIKFDGWEVTGRVETLTKSMGITNIIPAPEPEKKSLAELRSVMIDMLCELENEYKNVSYPQVVSAIDAYADAIRAEERAKAAKLVEALKLSEKWLLNCLPITTLEGPKPLPVIAEALAAYERDA